MSNKLSWNKLRKVGIRGKKQFFHLVCYRELEDELLKVQNEFFADFTKRNREELINSFLSVMAPFLLHHLNMKGMVKRLNLKDGNLPTPREKAEEPAVMDSHLWVALDSYNYRLLKKFHEAGETFSMAVVMRSLLSLVLRLITNLGRDGFLLWVEKWLKEYKEKTDNKFRERWNSLEPHMSFFQTQNVKYIGLYSSSYKQIHLYHPPPGK